MPYISDILIELSQGSHSLSWVGINAGQAYKNSQEQAFKALKNSSKIPKKTSEKQLTNDYQM